MNREKLLSIKLYNIRRDSWHSFAFVRRIVEHFERGIILHKHYATRIQADVGDVNEKSLSTQLEVKKLPTLVFHSTGVVGPLRAPICWRRLACSTKSKRNLYTSISHRVRRFWKPPPYLWLAVSYNALLWSLWWCGTLPFGGTWNHGWSFWNLERRWYWLPWFWYRLLFISIASI